MNVVLRLFTIGAIEDSGHYRAIGEGTIGLSELSECYRSAIGVYYRNYRTTARDGTTTVGSMGTQSPGLKHILLY